MRIILALSMLLAACGGKTDTTEAADSGAIGDAADTGTSTDVGTDAAAVCFTGDTVTSVPYKVCADDSDCTFLLHQTDCCGNSTWVGVAKSQKVEVQACEDASRSKFPGCGCPASQPEAEDGTKIDFSGMPAVHCVDRTSSSGICKTSAM